MTKPHAFHYKERIVVSPSSFSSSTGVRLETSATLLRNEGDSKSTTDPPTPFPSLVSNLFQQFQACRILIQTSSDASSSLQRDSIMPLPWGANDYATSTLDGIRSDMAPSGVSVTVKFVSENKDSKATQELLRQRFQSLLMELVKHRILLAPLDSVSFSRLHRWVYIDEDSSGKDVTQQVILPMEAAPMSSEGVMAVMSNKNVQVCPKQTGILGGGVVGSATDISNILFGAAPGISAAVPRVTWLDFVSTCHNDSGDAPCREHIFQGIHYGVRRVDTGSSNSAVPLSKLLPGGLARAGTEAQLTSFRTCPLADSTVVLQPQVAGDAGDSSGAAKHQSTTTVLENGASLDEVRIRLPVPAHQHEDQTSFSIASTILRPRGVANTGTLVTVVENKHKSCAATAVNLTTIVKTSLIQPLWQSFQAHHGASCDDAFFSSRQQPTTDGSNGVTIDLKFHDNDGVALKVDTSLPPKSCLFVSLQYNPKFLSFEHFPGDPNRGMELPPSILELQYDSACSTATKVRLYSNSLLLMPPVPDMSMPFNVISLTCTLYAFLFGTMLNLLLRKSSQKIQSAYTGKDPPKNKFQILKDKVKQKITAFKSKLQSRQKNNKTTNKEEQQEKEEVTDSEKSQQEQQMDEKSAAGKESKRGDDKEPSCTAVGKDATMARVDSK